VIAVDGNRHHTWFMTVYAARTRHISAHVSHRSHPEPQRGVISCTACGNTRVPGAHAQYGSCRPTIRSWYRGPSARLSRSPEVRRHPRFRRSPRQGRLAQHDRARPRGRCLFQSQATCLGTSDHLLSVAEVTKRGPESAVERARRYLASSGVRDVALVLSTAFGRTPRG
jgi:hypothetical protein